MSIRLNFFPAYIFVCIFIVHSSLYYLGKNGFYFSLKMCKQLFFNYMYKCKKYMIFFYDLIKALKRSSIKCINIKWKYLFVEKNDHTNNKKKNFTGFYDLDFSFLHCLKYFYWKQKKSITKYIVRIIYSEILFTVIKDVSKVNFFDSRFHLQIWNVIEF